MKTVFVVLFRGVGGATQLPTGPLRAALADAGFENVATYINSGNAVVRSPWAAERSHKAIVSLARDLFGFEKDVFLRSREQWRAAVEGNPYPEAGEKPTSVHFFALERAPSADAVEALRARLSPGERIHVDGDTMYMAHAGRLRCVEDPAADRPAAAHADDGAQLEQRPEAARTGRQGGRLIFAAHK